MKHGHDCLQGKLIVGVGGHGPVNHRGVKHCMAISAVSLNTCTHRACGPLWPDLLVLDLFQIGRAPPEAIKLCVISAG